jgi:hypothetical protein
MALIYDGKGDKQKSEEYKKRALKVDPHFFENAVKDLQPPPNLGAPAPSRP